MDNNYNIFSILNPSDNILLTNLSNSMINKLLNALDKYYLELRDNIGNHGNNTSGFEFEFEDANKSKIIDDMLNCNFNIKETKIYEDDSIPDGYEICTQINPETGEIENIKTYDATHTLTLKYVAISS